MTPACNTGVHPPSPIPPSRFDWYRATVPAHPELIAQACMSIGGPYVRREDGLRGRFNYDSRIEIRDGNDRVATILHGGRNGHPCVEASSDRSPALAGLLREMGPHKVTRCDVAVDMLGAGLYPRLKALAERIAVEQGISCHEIANMREEKGNTTVLGSNKSVVWARIYEKGKHDGVWYGDVDPHLLATWVRVELQIAPQKEMKGIAARFEPEDFWGISDWTRQLATEAFDMSPDPVPFHPRRTATDDKAFQTMLRQYRNLMHRRLQAVHNGDRAALMREVERSWFDVEWGEEAA